MTNLEIDGTHASQDVAGALDVEAHCGNALAHQYDGNGCTGFVGQESVGRVGAPRSSHTLRGVKVADFERVFPFSTSVGERRSS